ncbi:helix-turn-helix domain-containing protein [Palleronia caenipelagi]|uniref:Helix-turn-helix domain-containing protein n=1 Tax=Palleronia caenipelagi TaxID=2489174 RepID=A0A547PM68_9RHOB|nr:helix-turn-helix domain-containing protein [Palleronia caenipelagi]
MTSKKPNPAISTTTRPLIDPLTDSLTAFSDEDRAAAMKRFRVLQPHLEIGVPLLTAVAEASGHPLRTLRRWLARYRDGGLAGLVRRGRLDAGNGAVAQIGV